VAPLEPAQAPPDAATIAECRAALLRKIADGELEMPTSPAITLATRNLASSDNASATTLRELVEHDVGLAAQIVRMANGPLYAGLGRVSSLQAAIARIGFREVSHLAEALIAQRAFSVPDPRWQEMLKTMWRQAWRRAVTARFLAEHARIGLAPERAYLAALFCDLGVPLLCRSLRQHAPDLDEAEARAFIEVSHPALGSTVAAHWSLPPECVLVCARHHQEPSGTDDVPVPLRVVWAAEALAVARSGGALHPAMPSPPIHQLLPLQPQALEMALSRCDQYIEQHGWALDDAVGGPISDPHPQAALRAAAP
jgi:HD-like signal output (HDOD) protein